jgi:hypothetical protein
MKKISTTAARQVENFSQQTLTIGLDLVIAGVTTVFSMKVGKQ